MKIIKTTIIFLSFISAFFAAGEKPEKFQIVVNTSPVFMQIKIRSNENSAHLVWRGGEKPGSESIYIEFSETGNTFHAIASDSVLMTYDQVEEKILNVNMKFGRLYFNSTDNAWIIVNIFKFNEKADMDDDKAILFAASKFSIDLSSRTRRSGHFEFDTNGLSEALRDYRQKYIKKKNEQDSPSK
jgi:hypothetical protein